MRELVILRILRPLGIFAETRVGNSTNNFSVTTKLCIFHQGIYAVVYSINVQIFGSSRAVIRMPKERRGLQITTAMVSDSDTFGAEKIRGKTPPMPITGQPIGLFLS